ncbi:MAG: lysine--tRNA ligase, partial [Candidatus Abawacabacteria bacterium RIFCSPHIGHO2_01_FULL_46_8]
MAEAELIAVRKEKLAKLKAAGINPYPDHFSLTHSTAEIRKLSAKKKPRPLETIKKKPKSSVRLAGRIMTLRPHGKLTFATIQDQAGQIQLAFMADVLEEKAYQPLELFDLGDFVGAAGEMFITRKGELTLLCTSFQLLSKALRPLPEKWHGITDQEKCYRQRYLDLVMNKETRERFQLRAQVIDFLRQYLKDNNFLEVDTPVLQNKASGALAKPFKTHHASLDLTVYLRIAPETYLKRCVVGGLERVFEFARCFRNEGMDPSHLQDFTMLEFYYSYINAEELMTFTEKMLAALFKEILGTTKIKRGAVDLDFKPPLPRRTLAEVVKEHSGIDYPKYDSAALLLAEIKKKGVRLEIEQPEKLSYGNLIDALYKATARKQLIQPFFLLGHPLELSPLARRNDENPKMVDRFQLLADTWELVNAYSELIDPLDQRERFEEQAQAHARGDEEAMEMDEDYLLAMEHGMPPMAGFGLGIERLIAFL